MASADFELLTHWPSPYCIRTEVALAAKGVHYTKLPQNLYDKGSLLLQSNPVYKKVPVLLHCGTPVCDSAVIIQYLDEVFPSADGSDFLPKDPYDRAVARFWADFVDKKFFDILYGSIFGKTGAERKAGLKEAKENLSFLEEALGTVPTEPPFFGGAKLGYVDLILSPIVSWELAFEAAGNFKFEFEKLPRLAAWKKAFLECPVGREFPAATDIREFFLTNRLKRMGIQIEK